MKNNITINIKNNTSYTEQKLIKVKHIKKTYIINIKYVYITFIYKAH